MALFYGNKDWNNLHSFSEKWHEYCWKLEKTLTGYSRFWALINGITNKRVKWKSTRKSAQGKCVKMCENNWFDNVRNI